MLGWCANMKYEKICLMVPTYKRVPRLMSFINSAVSTADDFSRLLFCFCVNERDADTRMVLEHWGNDNNREVILENTIQPNLALYFNKMYAETKFKDAVVTELGDDMAFRSKGWDTRVLNTINAEDGKAIVYFNDNYVAQEKCCVNLFTTRKMVEATKKPFMCEFFHADMIDMVWTMVGAMTGTLRYQGDMIIEHNHASKQDQKQWDETFKRLRPVQVAANAPANQKLAVCYATLCAKNLIEAGVGRWNTLS